ncbi:MAG: hypothetical protein SGJ19_18335 [Planctomycetia bacterium]|nr:hypothetical protein [Planctomycetia bacterium]
MGGAYPGPHGRKRAIDLKAKDASGFLSSALPFVLRTMTGEQVGHVQMVLDAAVVNPAIEKQYAELMRRSVIAQNGVAVNRDPNTVLQAQRLSAERIPVSEADKHVRLEHTQLLAPDALLRRTDTPDEVHFLARVKKTLAEKGIWLRFDYKLIRDPADPSRWIADPHSFQAWLTLGYGGDTIPAKNGQLTLEDLLNTTILGANYYRDVSRGAIQWTLDKAIKFVENQILTGATWHEMQQQSRTEAKLGVELISDTLGGADFPSLKIWDTPHQFLTQSLKEKVGGNVRESSTSVMYAAFAAKAAAEVLDEYVRDTLKGAQRAVTILTVASVLGEIAGAFLIVRALFSGLIRLAAAEGSAVASTTSVATNVAKNRSPAAHYPTNYRGVAAYERTINQFATPHTGSGFGTVIKRYDLATRQKINGWIKDFEIGVKDLYKARGEAWSGGWVTSREEFGRLSAACDKKWGDIMSLFADLDRLAMGV